MHYSNDDRILMTDRVSHQVDLFSHSTKEVSSIESESQLENDNSIGRFVISMLGMSTVRGIGFKTIRKLIDTGAIAGFDTWDNMRLLKSISDAIYSHMSVDPNEIVHNREAILKRGVEYRRLLEDKGIRLVIRDAPDYPERLNRLKTSPYWLFVKGNASALRSLSIISMVGTRKATEQGMEIAYQSAAELTRKNFVVLSGLASGIDTMAHLGAVDNYGQSIAVLGHGIDIDLSKDQQEMSGRLIENNGAIVSEYLPNDPPFREGYLRRNELVASLSQVVIPVECPSMKSGTGATIRRALNLGTPVVGILPPAQRNNSLRRTEKALEELRIPIYDYPLENRTKSLWNYLIKVVPDHSWTQDKSRLDRFMNDVKHYFLSRRGNLEVSNKDIDKLASDLKELECNINN